jgi:Uma2 family endonuclease
MAAIVHEPPPLVAEGKYLTGAPEFTAEVCVSSAAYDLHQKMDLYEKAGVQEYLAVLVYEQEIRWHVLVDGRYQIMPPDADGVWRSRVFPGLWLDGRALLEREVQKVLSKLQEGLGSAEHRQFVEELAKRRSS